MSISFIDLLDAWEEFRKGKDTKADVLGFEWNLEPDLFTLERELAAQTYRHGPYTGFYITDPKLRHIHKATVRDRVVHHAVFKILNRVFEPIFIADSFSCRVGKGTHKGVARVQAMVRRVSKNATKPCYVLKCDVQKFFDSVDHDILLNILARRVRDPDLRWLLREIIESYGTDSRERERERESKKGRRGIPIGNLTSQIFANIYMNEFDQFVKHELHVKNYARYTDDFVVLANSSRYQEQLLPSMEKFLALRLRLHLHPKKIIQHSAYRGVDFLGYVIFPHWRLVRPRTRRRMLKKLRRGPVTEPQLQSYLGVLTHASTYKLSQDIRNEFWLG